MIRELRRRLLLRACAAARRFTDKSGRMIPMSVEDVFVAGWLSGYRASRRDLGTVEDSMLADFLKAIGDGAPGILIRTQLTKEGEGFKS